MTTGWDEQMQGGSGTYQMRDLLPSDAAKCSEPSSTLTLPSTTLFAVTQLHGSMVTHRVAFEFKPASSPPA